MRVVITGATGNVGTSLVEALSREPAVDSVVGIARRRPDWEVAKTTWVEADVGNDDLAPIFDGAGLAAETGMPTLDPEAGGRASEVASGVGERP